MGTQVLLVLLSALQATPSPVLSACETDYPPFCFEDDSGLAAGFSVELLDAALAAMGREATYAVGPWSEVKGWLETGRVECLPLVGRTPEREPFFDFTFPYMTLHGAVVVRADCDSVLSVHDLNGLTVGVMTGDNAEEFMQREDYGANLVSTETFEEALQSLSAGELDAVVIQRLVAMRLIARMGSVDLRVMDWPMLDFRQDFCFAVQKGNSELLAVLNEGLAVVVADGTYSHLHAKWFAHMEIPQGRTLVFGGDRNFPPWEFLDSLGNPAGMNVEIVRAIAAEAGLEVEVRLGDWSSIIAGLENGTLDGITGMFYSTDRDLLYDFTQPHTTVNYVAVVRGGEPPASLSELAGLSLVVQRGDLMHDFLLEHGLEANLHLAVDQEAALRAVHEGEHDLALVSRISALYWVSNNSWNLSVGTEPLHAAEYCIAVAPGDLALRAQFGEGLRVLMETGAYHRIFRKWMGDYVEEGPPSMAVVIRRALVFIVPLVFLLILVLLWLRLMRREVRLRTEELSRSDKLLREMGRIALVGGWEFNPVTGQGTWTEEVARIHGLPPEEETSLKKGLGFYKGQSREKLVNAIREAARNGTPYDLELELVTGSGARKWVRSIGKPVFEDGRVVRIQGSFQDISSLKGYELRIEHLNHVLRAIRDINQLIVREHDPRELIAKAAELLVQERSYSSALLVSTDEKGTVTGWSRAGHALESAGIEQMLMTGEVPDCFPGAGAGDGCTVVEKTTCLRCPLSRESQGNVSVCAPLNHAGGRFGFMAICLEDGAELDGEEASLLSEMAGDIAYALASIGERRARLKAESEKTELRKQLLQSQKMEAIGQLAGGIAHDFNNMLQVILGHAGMLSQCCAEHSESVKEIIAGATRASELTRQLLLFSRRQVMSLQPLDFNELVENLLKMIRRLIGEHIRLEWLPGSSVGSVHADPGMMEQVLMNLCVNARDAMPRGGVLTIETLTVIVDSDYCATHTWASPGRYVLLSVTDTGVGMNQYVLGRMYEPFYTTKEPGKGTGIGLATVYGIVKQHGGMINAYSEPEKGTIFKVYLPVSELKASRVGSRIEGPTVGGTETILLAEDDEMVRHLAKQMLEIGGYTVLEANDGREAVTVFRENPGVQLLLLDVIMPVLGGKEALEAIRAMNPSVPALFSSGYSENAIHTNFVLHEDFKLIQKPYSAEELLRAVRSAIDGKQKG